MDFQIRKCFWLVATFLGIFIYLSEDIRCNTIMELRLKEFQNPDNKLLNGKCCDNQYLCMFGCEHFFELCIKPYPVVFTQCTNYLETRVLAGGKILFPLGMQLNAHTTNPWIFTYENAYVSISTIYRLEFRAVPAFFGFFLNALGQKIRN